MNDPPPAIFRARFILAMALMTFAVSLPAQENPDEEPEPATESAAAEAAPAAGVTRQQTGSQVMDRIELERTEITGNQELPKVLYIVPWKDSDPDDLPGPPAGTLLDEEPAPLDREELGRRVEYFDILYGKSE